MFCVCVYVCVCVCVCVCVYVCVCVCTCVCVHLVLIHLLRCGEPISGIILKSTRSFGDFRGCRPLGGSIANWIIFPRFLLSLSPLSRWDPRDQVWQWATSTSVCVHGTWCVCVCLSCYSGGSCPSCRSMSEEARGQTAWEVRSYYCRLCIICCSDLLVWLWVLVHQSWPKKSNPRVKSSAAFPFQSRHARSENPAGGRMSLCAAFGAQVGFLWPQL